MCFYFFLLICFFILFRGYLCAANRKSTEYRIKINDRGNINYSAEAYPWGPKTQRAHRGKRAQNGLCSPTLLFQKTIIHYVIWKPRPPFVPVIRQLISLFRFPTSLHNMGVAAKHSYHSAVPCLSSPESASNVRTSAANRICHLFETPASRVIVCTLVLRTPYCTSERYSQTVRFFAKELLHFNSGATDN